MIEFTLHPQVHATGQSKGLIGLLEKAWVREHRPGSGQLCLMSGFGNYNGGVRFFDVFRQHTRRGGSAVAIFGGSTSRKLTSRQVVEELLKCGVEVHLINRKRILHAKCYGSEAADGSTLIVSSGNFTGPGMSQNIEGSVFLDRATTILINFRWNDLLSSVLKQKWEFYRPSLSDLNAPAWRLLYDETESDITLDESEDVTMVLLLSHADTARIQASRGTAAGKGTQYFWLSKDCYDFFPPLTILNARGTKRTYACLVKLHYIDLKRTDGNCRVTFEAENNFDFRLGTGLLRYTALAQKGDIATITRTGHDEYELRLFKKGTPEFTLLNPFAVTFVGHQGKRYGYISNEDFSKLLAVKLPAARSESVAVQGSN